MHILGFGQSNLWGGERRGIPTSTEYSGHIYLLRKDRAITVRSRLVLNTQLIGFLPLSKGTLTRNLQFINVPSIKEWVSFI